MVDEVWCEGIPVRLLGVGTVSYTHLDVYKRQIFCRMIGTLEADEKRHAIWEYLKENNPGAYGAVRRSALNVGTNLPGELGRSLGISGYHLAQKVFKFN